ncbi:MAG: hypothetical protein NPIRA04_26600 [Nitrospirales bacterium]|nr:MAG: hypothetical protein NPIRA04_26600 [Nitrospirales bacterium]
MAEQQEITVETLIENCEDLPTLPDVYLRVRDVIEDPKASMIDIAKALSIDPAMTARVLKLVNSPFYGLTGKVESVSRAASILGMQAIHDLVLASSLATTFSQITPTIMDMKTFWQCCVERGLLARTLARTCHLVDSERLFVGGLLSDIGHLVLYLKLPDLAAELLNQAMAEGRIRPALEQEKLGFDAAEVGARLLAKWHLPLNYQLSTRYHQHLSEASERTLELEILHMAGVVMECQLLKLPRELWRQWMMIQVPELRQMTDEEIAQQIECAQEDLTLMLEMMSPTIDHVA